MAITETLIKQNLPDVFIPNYELIRVQNNLPDFMAEIDRNKTQCISKSWFKYTSIIMPTIAFSVPNSLKNNLEILKEF
ncbi:MAG: hypothetical protein WBN69_13095 [Eudoraea sp.]